jgi:hypothetical protein
LLTMRHPANAVFLAALVLSSVQCVAQVPPQFKGLLTTTTDYTCAGAVPCPTWPMPDLPPAGGSYADPTWGTTTYRLAVPSVNPGTAFTTYSRVQAWNSNNTKMFLTEAPRQAYMDLYDATTTPPTPINRITATDGTLIDSMNGDALWANTDPNRIYYVPWAANAIDGLQLRYVDVSKCTKRDCTLKPVTVHSFSCKTDATSPLGNEIPGNKVETGSGGQGGMFDSTDRYFSFTCDNVNRDGRTIIDFIRYDRTLDKVTTQVKWYTVCPGSEPKGCKVFNECPRGEGKCDTNILRMNQHPNANFITVLWQCQAHDSAWTRGCGTEVYGPTYNYLGPASASLSHHDNGFDVNGVPVMVFVSANRLDRLDERSIEVTNLTTLNPAKITSKRVLLPCTYSRTSCESGTYLGARVESSHISMTGSWGSLPGYALFSTMTSAGAWGAYRVGAPPSTTLGTEITTPGEHTVSPASMRNIGVGVISVIDWKTPNSESVKWTSVDSKTATATFRKAHAASATVSCVSCGDTGFGAMENLAVKIDTKAPDNSNAVFYRIGRAMSIRDADYNAEPHTAVNRDFTQITWGSNWNTDGGRVYGFWTKLPAAAPKASDAPASPKAKPE